MLGRLVNEGETPGGLPVAPRPGRKFEVMGKEALIVGGGDDTLFSEQVPDGGQLGGLLIGLEVSTEPWLGHPMARSFRPIYMVGGKEVMGKQWGTPSKTVTTLKAKEGYAVGGLSVMHGLNFDGLSVTFMKMTEDGLDPKESYESEYVGSDEKKPLTKMLGDGTPVVGVVGRENESEKAVKGFGLLFKGQAAPKR